MNNIFFLWLAGSTVFLVLEMGHPGLFYYLSFFFGALGAAIAVLLTNTTWVHTATFIVTTLIAFLIFKKLISNKVSNHQVTNTDALVGKQGTVTSTINPGQLGYVRIDSEVWAARNNHQLPIYAGSRITVVAVRGAHVVVEPITQ